MFLVRWFLKLFFRVGRARWIVSSGNDPGFKIFGVPIYYYKWDDVFLFDNEMHCRVAQKHEITIKGAKHGRY
jgi:hypothetical protein